MKQIKIRKFINVISPENFTQSATNLKFRR